MKNDSLIQKSRYYIVSRKITKFVSKSYSSDFRKTELAKQFVQDVKPVFLEYAWENILNTDQSGFLKELHSNWGFAIKDTKKVEIAVQSVNAINYSYTIQLLVNVAGELLFLL